jgi:hypothetical protein
MSDAKARIVGVFGRAAETYDDVEPRHFSHFGRLLVEHAQLAPSFFPRRKRPLASSASIWPNRWLLRCNGRSTVAV